jgi:hypothetical protein
MVTVRERTARTNTRVCPTLSNSAHRDHRDELDELGGTVPSLIECLSVTSRSTTCAPDEPRRHVSCSSLCAMKPRVTTRGVAFMQGTLFVATGLWPIVHMRSFESVTGPKRDRWLVTTMGGLIAVIGASLLEAARSRSVRSPSVALAVGSAAALALSDAIYVSRRVISRVYLADAAAETLLITLWMAAIRHRRVEHAAQP